MTATDELRRLLDERGVEHVDAEDGHTQHTWWSDGDHEVAASNSGERLAVYNLTPEQAIAATLGRGTCRETVIDHYWRGCGSCGYIWEFMYGIGKCERPCYCPNCGRRCVG